jgi:hypothetical protein
MLNYHNHNHQSPFTRMYARAWVYFDISIVKESRKAILENPMLKQVLFHVA